MPADRLVGEAYVLMRADGRLMKSDIKRLAGQGAKTYAQQWSDELEQARRTMETRFMKSITQATAEVDFSKLRKEYGSIEATVRGLRAELGKLTFDSAGNLLPKKERLLLLDAYEQITDALDEWADETTRVERAHAELNKHIVSYGDIFNRQIIDKWKQYANVVSQATQSGDWSKLRRENEAIADSVQRITTELEDSRVHMKLYDEDISRATQSLERWAEAQAKIDLEQGTRTVEINGRTVRRESGAFVQALQAMADESDIFSITFGRAFGKGSRNNFLNWVGSVVQGMTALVTVVPARAIAVLGKAVEGFSASFSTARAAGIGVFSSALRGLAGMFTGPGGLIGLFVTVGAAAVAFGKVLPAIASAVSMLAANAISLVGALGVGVTGGLLAIAPAAVAAVGGLVVLGTAWASWAKSDEGVKAIERQEKRFEQFFQTLYPAIRTFNALYEDAFVGLGERVRPGILSLANQLKALFNEKDTKGRLDAWGGAITRMFNSLSTAAVRFTDGLIAFFVPILPYAEKLANAIKDMATRFSAWAQSAEGQNSIADFMDRAWTAAKAVWDLLREIGELIGTVFDVGASETGTGWIQGMADSLADFNDYLKSPEGRAALEGWFQDAKEFGEDVGRVIGDVVRIFKELDSPEGRETAKDVLDAIKQIADFAVDVASVADSVGDIVDTLTGAASPIAIIMNALNGDAPDLEWGDTIDFTAVQEKFDEMKTAVSTWASETWASISGWASDTAATFEEWRLGVGESISGFFLGLGESISTFFSEGPERFRTWALGVMTSMVEGLIEGQTIVFDWIATFLEGLATSITEFDLSEFGTNLLTNIQEGLTLAGDAITTWVSEKAAAIGQWRDETWATFKTWASGVPGQISGGLEQARGSIGSWISTTLAQFAAWVGSTRTQIAAWVSTTVAQIGAWVGQQRERFGQWAAQIPQIISTGIARMGAFLAALPGRVAGWLSSLPERLLGPFRTGWNRVNEIFNGAPGRLASAISSVIGAIAGRLAGVYNTIVGPFQRAWDRVQQLISSIRNAGSNISVGGIDLTPWNAAGNIYNGPTVVGVGEAGREAIVPLERPLSQVNPNVRMLSAIAQGKMPWMAGGGVVGGTERRTVVFEDGAVQVVTAATNPNIVAAIVTDYIADALVVG